MFTGQEHSVVFTGSETRSRVHGSGTRSRVDESGTQSRVHVQNGSEPFTGQNRSGVRNGWADADHEKHGFVG